jgi:hypothetical protein
MGFRCSECSATYTGGDSEKCTDCRDQSVRLRLCRSCIANKLCYVCGVETTNPKLRRRELLICTTCKEKEKKKPKNPEIQEADQ